MEESTDYRDQILQILAQKSGTKQFIYRNTLDIFKVFKQSMNHLSDDLSQRMKEIDPNIEISYTDNSDFEAQIKFSGDVLVFNMHTNVFNFDENHEIHKLPYVLEDPYRSYCGMIEIYNFLADSLKYNRVNDTGQLIGRIFVNKECHFFVEGQRQLGFLYNDFSNMILSHEFIKLIIESSMLFALDFDLWVPPYDQSIEISVLAKIQQQGISLQKTSKRLGFQAAYMKGKSM